MLARECKEAWLWRILGRPLLQNGFKFGHGFQVLRALGGAVHLDQTLQAEAWTCSANGGEMSIAGRFAGEDFGSFQFDSCITVR